MKIEYIPKIPSSESNSAVGENLAYKTTTVIQTTKQIAVAIHNSEIQTIWNYRFNYSYLDQQQLPKSKTNKTCFHFGSFGGDGAKQVILSTMKGAK